MKIKAHDLSELVHDMVSDAIETDSYQYERTCKFIINYATNGGHQGRAARDAGFPDAGADAQASKLLKNDKILSIVKRIKEYVFVADNFVNLLTKNHLIFLYYQMAMKYMEKAPSQAVNALKEVAQLAGFYEQKEGPQDFGVLLEQANKAAEILERCKTESNKTKRRLIN